MNGAEANRGNINNVQAGRGASSACRNADTKKIAFLSAGGRAACNQDRIADYRCEFAAKHLSVPDSGIFQTGLRQSSTVFS